MRKEVLLDVREGGEEKRSFEVVCHPSSPLMIHGHGPVDLDMTRQVLFEYVVIVERLGSSRSVASWQS
jgi:hypothetical protein